MHLHRPARIGTLMVPVLVLALSVTAIASITLLHHRADASSNAQLTLAETHTALNALQVAFFQADKAFGGSLGSPGRSW